MIDDKLNKQGFFDNGIFINNSGAHMLRDGKIAFSTEYGLSDVPSVSFDEPYSLCYEGEKGNINLVVGRKKCKWIPCSEQLPEFGEPVIICRKNGKVEQGKRDVNGYWSVYGSRIKEVVAWMPLPEPYREE